MSREPAGDDAGTAARRAGPAALPGAVGAPVKLLALLDAHPPLRAGLTALGDMLLFDGVLPAAERELLILRTAANGAPYIREGHRPIAARAGLTDREIDAICAGMRATGGDPRHDALLRACDELLEHGELCPATRAVLVDEHGAAGVLEIVAVVGFYRLLATVTRAYGLQPEP